MRNSLAFNLLLMQGWSYYLLGRVYQEWNQLELAAKYYKLEIDQGFTSNLFCSVESIAGYVFVLEALGRHALAQQSLEFPPAAIQRTDCSNASAADGLDCLVEIARRQPCRGAPLG